MCIPVNNNLTDSARGAFLNVIELDSDLALATGIRWLLTVEMELVVVHHGLGRVSWGCSIDEFASVSGTVNESGGALPGPWFCAVWIEGTNTGVEVDPIASFEIVKVSQCSMRIGSVGSVEQWARGLCAPFHQVVNSDISGYWDCERHDNEGEESDNDEGELHLREVFGRVGCMYAKGIWRPALEYGRPAEETCKILRTVLYHIQVHMIVTNARRPRTASAPI